ncbi:uncharacterized protein NESG_00440 [Nematocida ausubeli]|uniref:Uncharacterized protein n=1 Tax=Nematocida ausubeli (strain ATCC PRA-371 / ERTm2) TaxID=1913371 RepID=A0A086J5E4_NEMA1|nr:uncharacterized protein NESG_00440 [Nematocida ausubeli]KAI5137551.1 hypothetical protein NEAUS06_2273 [Nematocida ausubeli]KFG27362.1 hypothetical protein NESG_00440 [Nematocida ausubeli]
MKIQKRQIDSLLCMGFLFLSIALCKTQMTLSNLKALEDHCINGSNEIPVRINPSGPLNLVHGYIHHYMGYIHNKRFFSPGILLDFQMEILFLKDENFPSFSFTWASSLDHPRPSSSKNITARYKYYKALLRFFPSHNKSLEIINESARWKATFCQFLQLPSVKKHSYHILASLLLMSEGIPVGLGTHLIRHKDKNTKIYLEGREPHDTIELLTLASIDGTKKFFKLDLCFIKDQKCFSYYSVLDDIISAFTEKQFFSNNLTENTTADGSFMENPRFLIQSFLYAYLDMHSAKLFFQAVYDLLQTYSNIKTSCKFKLKEEFPKILNRFFVEYNRPEGFSYAGALESSLTVQDEEVFEVSEDSCRSDSSRFSSCSEEKFNLAYKDENQLDSILGLIAWISYDLKTERYSTEKIKNAPEIIKKFFSIYKVPRVLHEDECRHAWYEAITEAISNYNLNLVSTGILGCLNMVCDLLQIKKRFGLTEIITKFHKGEDEDPLVINSCIQDLLYNLTDNFDGVRIFFDDLQYKDTRDNLDIFGAVSIEFTINPKISKFQTACKKPRIFTYIFTAYKDPFVSQTMKKYFKIKNSLRGQNYFINHLCQDFIDRIIEEHRSSPVNFTSSIESIIKKPTITEINKLFKLSRINQVNYKIDLIIFIFMQGIKKDLAPGHILIQLGINLLASTELQNWRMRCKALIVPIIYALNLKDQNSNIFNYTTDTDKSAIDTYYQEVLLSQSMQSIFNYALTEDPKVFLICFDTFCYMTKYSPFYPRFSNLNLYICLFKYKKALYANNFIEIFKKYLPKASNELENILMDFFVLACESNPPCPKRIRISYDLIKEIPKETINSKVTKDNYKRVLYTLSRMNKKLSEKDDCLMSYFERLQDKAIQAEKSKPTGRRTI